jgi:3',5'-cyclic-AMP phosphodiesterase
MRYYQTGWQIAVWLSNTWKMKALTFLLLVLLLGSCDNFEYSPNQLYNSSSPSNLNALNLEKLMAGTDSNDTLTIAFTGDSQRFYDEMDDFVDRVNEIPDVDFIFLAGDITDFGLLAEYQWIHKSLARLTRPYLGVIGNHDVIANGEEVFTRMFGPLNYSFVYDSVKFVVHNTNSREYTAQTIPDIEWLRSELSVEENASAKYFIAVSHVPPTDKDFNRSLVAPYSHLFATTPGFLVSLHGHIHEHTDSYPFNDGVRYITSFAYSQRNFVLLKIVDGQVFKEIISY